MPTENEFRGALASEFQASERRGYKSLQIQARGLNAMLGGEPAPEGEDPILACCEAMYAEMRPGDEVVRRPAGHIGRTHTIC